MAEVSIASAIKKLEGTTIAERGEGLDDLKRLLSERRNASNVDALGDDIFHKIFELLYSIVSREKPKYIKAATKTSKANANLRLQVTAAALRLTVEAGVSRIRFKTALSVLDHVADTLLLPDGSLFEPLKNDYLKVFRILLDYAPHGEHMKQKQWHVYVDFALVCLSIVLEEDSVENGTTTSREASLASRNDPTLSLRLSQRSGRSIGKEKATFAEETVAALKSLTSITNARIMSRATAISETVQEFLTVARTGQEDAFEILNNIMFVSLSQDVAFTQSLLLALVPIMRRLWSSRSGTLREQMLITLFTCRDLFVAPSGPWPRIETAKLEPLLANLISDYCTRSEKDTLHFDDMQPLLPSERNSLQLTHFKPLRSSARAATCWMSLQVIASLIAGLDRAGRPTSAKSDAEQTPRKRRKVQNHLDEVLELALARSRQERLAALQIILFLLDQAGAHELDRAKLLHMLLPELKHEDSTIQTWVFLLYSRLALEDSLQSPETSHLWLQVWDAARRATAALFTTRAACHLLSVLLQARLFSTTMSAALLEDALFGGGNSGPSSLTDTSLILMTCILRSKVFEDERRFEALCLKVIGWLNLRWTLPSTLDRLHNAHINFHVRPEHIYHLLISLCGFSDRITPFEDWTPVHSSSRAAMISSANAGFVQYLLSAPSETPREISGNIAPRQLDMSTTSRLFRAVRDFLVNRLKDFLKSWEAISAERSSNIGNDIVEIVTVGSIVLSAIWTRCDGLQLGSPLPSILSETQALVSEFITDQKNMEASRGMISRICFCVVVVHAQLFQGGVRNCDQEHQRAIEFALNLARRGMAEGVLHETSDLDLVDEDQWDSQATQKSQTSTGATVLRVDLPFCQDTNELLARYAVELATALQMVKSQGSLDSSASTLIFDEIVSLDPAVLIGARGAVRDFLCLETATSRGDAHRLVERIGQVFLQQEAFERCETALCFCLETLRSLVDLWTADEDDDLATASFDIYDWFLNTALEKGILSSRVLSVLTDLLDSLLLKNASYGGEDVPSPRTSLLRILEVSDPASQYHMADKLSHIFEKYVLTQHEAIFEDIVGRLPSDPDNKEGIAVRLYIVSHLGAHWHTVLRQAIYHVFETVAHVPATTPLALDCIKRTCRRLKLDHPRQLFKLFSPQIFYTWLSQESISHMPFQAFGYTSLPNMLHHNISELTGQIALRGMTHAEDLAQLVGVEWNTLLTEEFASAEAYTLASETSVPNKERLYDGSEKLVRKQLGSGVYLQRLRECLPDIIVQLIVCLQDDRGIEKSLPSANLALWQEMVDQAGQHNQLPLAQQPCFRARCLPEELNYLCSRLDLRQEDIWTSALLVYVFRQLLDRARPALGPLHTCSIIRKIRILISLAGSAAVEGYPLEMMLHSLRPYLTLFECAGDAMGIYRFLLRRGAPYLSTRSSFIAGLGVAIFASLTGFITLPQESTTQESHFVATMTKAQEFRNFLGQYLESLQLKDSTLEAVQTYKQVIHHAKAVTQPGSSTKSTSEGQLLYVLLTDQSCKDPLLSSLHFELSIGILCQQFAPAADFQDDVIANDEDASRVLPVLESLLRRMQLDKSFQTWAAQVIGRGFVMRGLGSAGEDQVHQLRLEVPTHSKGFPGFEEVSSYTSMIRHLLNLPWTSEYPSSTLAENTLQLIFSKLSQSNEGGFLEHDFDTSLMHELSFVGWPCPATPLSNASTARSDSAGTAHSSRFGAEQWAADALTEISDAAAGDPVLGFLKPLINAIPESAEALFPYGVHLVLLNELDSRQVFREKLSGLFSDVLSPQSPSSNHASRLVLKTLLYLRTCRLPRESNMAQRNSWLEIDLCHAAIAASKCQMWHEALLFLELHSSQVQLQTGRSSRRSFVMADSVPLEIVSRIYENVDDPDFFYGKHQTFDLQSIIGKMSHEGASQKSLSFHSALLDSQLRVNEQEASLSDMARTTASTLSAANMQGISDAVRQHYEAFNKEASVENSSTGKHWDLLHSSEATSFSTGLSSLFRSMHSLSNKESLVAELDKLLFEIGGAIKVETMNSTNASRLYSNLTVLAEARQIAGATTAAGLEATCAALAMRNKHVKLAEFEALSPILAGREAAFAAIRQNSRLQSCLSLSVHQALLFEIQVARQSLGVASSFDAPQFCLNRALYLSELDHLAQRAGLGVDVAINYDLAGTLWAQEETSASIGILEELRNRKDVTKQAITVTRADILTDLGHKVAEARLEKPDEIIERYLAPAIHELHGLRTSSAAGRVFHNFAAFCDMQLQDTDNLDDFTRISKIRERKYQEVHELKQMMENSKSDQQKQKLKSHFLRARNWLKLDDEEWKRVSENRENLILQCLENYLLSMTASDDYPNDTLRFIALWLNQAESPTANATVHKHLSSVPTIKFAPLVNQLTSRILDVKDDFQRLLKDLMFRICSDHPYHSLYQAFATSKSKAPSGDDIAASRWTAANKLTERVRQHSTSSAIWTAVHNTCVALNKVAVEPTPEKHGKSAPKTLQLRKLQGGPGLEAQITKPTSKIPPLTMNIALRVDRDYSKVPTSISIGPELSIASGVSAPKIATIMASDGSRHKLLLKGGNDDLRQDAIMEQVFEQVSNLLKEHRTTRQRNLGIRTYKVIPLTKNSGIIEFVQNTIPLNEYLLPAHERYYPKDHKPSKARKDIADAQTKNQDQRVRAYQTVATNFHPVMRFFFMEKFLDPDDWFYKRLNYSRSTAAVSILGHVLGLGDRHGHNILLDEKTGEVVHIDLGVAFEAGRVLPVPEVVPFRLTRDLVDGMGLTGVEGVFRRCCNFTLEALRRDQEAIMTILDVLRYDPLYSWSISPLRLQKMQENNAQAGTADGAAAGIATPSISGTSFANDCTGVGVMAVRREEAEPSEADRALTVVAKKLGKALSVEATVNELIRQATDERNLAVLYCGWAAYA
ncbi:Serine/threonine-protein kinase tel1 [Cladophialophora chaetospira]|uniref:Serine/threonine-protein kinase Tel1 n=1 Tax=Cladophialophora chaetospira TaxID=386627 RepID=A0AA38XI85_9EURO|nr:Serine/threonine-protein kinase tel1 [Cladophialophora chaetospira]